VSFPRYSKYKDTGVEWLGEVPVHWGVSSLRHSLTGIFNGLTADQVDQSEFTVPVTRIETISDGFIDWSKVGHVKKTEARQDRRLRPGDICFSNINSLNMIGNCAIYGDDKELYGGMNLLVLRPAPEVDSSHMYWLVRSSEFRKTVESLAKPAINQASISQNSLVAIRIPVPSRTEQTAIAAFLDREIAKIDALVAEQEKLIALLKEKRQALISHAVTKGLNPDAPMKDSGIEWLGQVRAHWNIRALKRVCSLLKDGTHLPPARVESGVPLLSVRNMIDGEFQLRFDDSMISQENYCDLCRSFVPLPGDILLAIVGATLGKTAIIQSGLGEFHIQRSVAIFRPLESAEGRWLHLIFQSTQFQQLLWEHVGYSAQPGIYLGTLAEFRIPLPSVAEQEEIISRLSPKMAQFKELVAGAQHAIDLLKERRSALISAAVTGKIDVRGVV
jgi:type I restriction enzyme, S subunit